MKKILSFEPHPYWQSKEIYPTQSTFTNKIFVVTSKNKVICDKLSCVNNILKYIGYNGLSQYPIESQIYTNQIDCIVPVQDVDNLLLTIEYDNNIYEVITKCFRPYYNEHKYDIIKSNNYFNWAWNDIPSMFNISNSLNNTFVHHNIDRTPANDFLINKYSHLSSNYTALFGIALVNNCWTGVSRLISVETLKVGLGKGTQLIKNNDLYIEKHRCGDVKIFNSYEVYVDDKTISIKSDRGLIQQGSSRNFDWRDYDYLSATIIFPTNSLMNDYIDNLITNAKDNNIIKFNKCKERYTSKEYYSFSSDGIIDWEVFFDVKFEHNPETESDWNW